LTIFFFRLARSGKLVEEKRKYLRGLDLLIAMAETQLTKEEENSINQIFNELALSGEQTVVDKEAILESIALPVISQIVESKLLFNFETENLLDLEQLTNKRLFTFVRFKTLQLLGLFFRVKETSAVFTSLLKHKILPLLVHIFYSFDWNNFVHNEIADVFLTVLGNGSEEMLKQLFHEAKFLHLLISSYKKEAKKDIGKHVGFFHHLTVIANEIKDLSSKNSTLLSILTSLPEYKDYQELLTSELATTLHLLSSVFKF